MRDPGLGEALHEITAIRQQLVRSTEFRGYGPAMLAATSGLALAACLVQAHWMGSPPSAMAFVDLWTATAAISALLIAIESWRRARREHAGLADAMLRSAFAQFAPAAAAGVLLTLVLLQTAPASLWMLPGLWQILFSLGVFASCRFLPHAIVFVGVWYLACGLVCLAWAHGPAAFSPWAMTVPFAAGQAFAAIILYGQPKEDSL